MRQKAVKGNVAGEVFLDPSILSLFRTRSMYTVYTRCIMEASWLVQYCRSDNKMRIFQLERGLAKIKSKTQKPSHFVYFSTNLTSDSMTILMYSKNAIQTIENSRNLLWRGAPFTNWNKSIYHVPVFLTILFLVNSEMSCELRGNYT